jgi:cell fate (sporulation/competence/biofilm development) regulator YlbF (YheA/YmcA/DUF963 family)
MDIKLEEEKINRMRHEAMMHSNANGLTRTLVNMRKQIAEAVATVSAAKSKLKATEKGSWKKSYAPETEPKEIQKTHNPGKIYHEEAEQVDEADRYGDKDATHMAHFKHKEMNQIIAIPVRGTDRNNAEHYFKKRFGKTDAAEHSLIKFQPIKEEVEQVDELKKATLRSYAAKRGSQPDKGKNGANIALALTKAAGKPPFPGMKKAKVNATEDNESHTHAAHFENDKGEWTGMQLFTAKDDDDAIKKAHELAKEHGKLSSVVRHVQIKESEILDEAPLTKAEREAKRAARNARMAGSVKNAVQKLSTAGKKKAGLTKPEPKKPEETPLQKIKRANQAKQDAYYAKGGREGFGSGGGTRNASPLEKAITAVKEKPSKGAGASPAEIEAEKERKKKESMAGYEKVKPLKGKIIGEDLKVGDKDDDGKMEVDKRTGGTIKQSQSLVDKAKRKYLGVKKGKTATGSAAHAIDTEPKITTPEDKKLGKK